MRITFKIIEILSPKNKRKGEGRNAYEVVAILARFFLNA